ncbi:MAG: hypothetical protein ACRESR_08545 [Gammaproteobacteria bacterium]
MDKLNSFFVTAGSLALVAAIGATPVALAGDNGQMNQPQSNQPQTQENNGAQRNPPMPSDVKATIEKFKRKAPAIGKFFNDAYGYAVFPSIGKGGVIIGGAHGGGSVFKHGRLVGHSTATNFSIGAQIGGKIFSEAIFFKNAKAFDRLTGGDFQFGSNTVSIGVPTKTTDQRAATTPANAYNDRGVAVFTMTKSGFMVGIKVGGQKFSFTPVAQSKNNH